MRQPSSTGRRYDYGYLPKTAGSGSRGSGASSATPNAVNPEIVVNGHGNDSSIDSVGSAIHHRSGVQSENTRLGNAANPNRSDMPDTGRRKSFDPVSVSSLVLFKRYTKCTLVLSFVCVHEV